MSNERIIKDIPTHKVRDIIRGFEREGCSAKKEKQPNGKWTVRATCPDN